MTMHFLSILSSLPWRVNCWFCSSNTWVKYPEHNCWTCPKCEQYNGFTKDGDYNKEVTTTNCQVKKTSKKFNRSPPRYSLCRICNIKQELKLMQLLNFVPIKEKNHDEEFASYRMKVEKCYTLCRKCKIVLEMKLRRDKETLINTKLLERYLSEKKEQLTQPNKNKAARDMISITSMLIAAIPLILVLFKFWYKIEEYLTQTTIDLLWLAFGICEVETILDLNPLLAIAIKVTSVCILMLVYMRINTFDTNISKRRKSPIFVASVGDDESEPSEIEESSDDDISLSRFGICSHTDSLNESVSPTYENLFGTNVSPRNNTLFRRPLLKPTLLRTGSDATGTGNAKSAFKRYQRPIFEAKNGPDPEVDGSRSLSMYGSPKSGNNIDAMTSSASSGLYNLNAWVASGYWPTSTARSFYNFEFQPRVLPVGNSRIRLCGTDSTTARSLFPHHCPN